MTTRRYGPRVWLNCGPIGCSVPLMALAGLVWLAVYLAGS